MNKEVLIYFWESERKGQTLYPDLFKGVWGVEVGVGVFFIEVNF